MTRARVALTVCVLCLVTFASLPQAQQRPDRSKPPALGPAPSVNLPPIQKRMLREIRKRKAVSARVLASKRRSRYS